MTKKNKHKKNTHSDDGVIDPFADREAERYESPIPSREYIVEVLSSEGPLTEKQLQRRLGMKGQQQRHALTRRLGAMRRDSQLLCNRAGEYGVIDKMDLIAGKVQSHRDGFGFLLRENDDDIYLSPRQMSQLIHGDDVLVSISGENRRGQLEGQVVEVVSRNTERVVGRLAQQMGETYVVPDNPRITHDFLVDKNEVGKARQGDYVIVQITQQPEKGRRPRAMVIEHLGEPLAPGIEIDIAIHRYELPYQFSNDCLQQASDLSDQPSEKDKKGRHDLRGLPLVTIDGEDARDFDDAVYCEQTKNGGFRLWVAIADVAHYVPVGTPLDREASSRGTSVYFPGRVVPMLPEALSNGLCSLNPDVDRLCMVCEMEINREGDVTGHAFFEAVMHSHARLTYNEVAEALGLLDVEPRKGLMQRIKPVMKPLQTLHKLFTVLQRKRSQRGAIEFETVETQIIFNDRKKIDEIVPRERNDAHRIIEECMLCANVAAADFIQQHKIACLVRVHEGPKPDRLERLRAYLSQLGLQLGGGDKPSPQHYRVLMQEVAERADAHLIQVMLLRSMSQAVYQLENLGHFGLSYDAYAHFTSPIRRYPDLLVHRAIKQVIRSRRNSESVKRVEGAGILAKKVIYPYSPEDIVALGAHCSMTERRADDATRDVMDWLKCEYLETKLGSTFGGVITAVTGFGFFVELDDLYAEGLVHVSTLGKDYFHYDQAAQALIGERTRRAFRLGDKVTVVIASVDLDQRQVELELSGSVKRRDDSDATKPGLLKKKKSRERKGQKKPVAGKRKGKETSAKKSRSSSSSAKNKKRR